MKLDEYQMCAEQYAIYPGAGDMQSFDGLAYVTLGLNGEAGELANKIKKIARDRQGVISSNDRRQLSDELGDVLWYVAQLATQLGVNLSDVAESNIHKLADRATRGVLQGSGDER